MDRNIKNIGKDCVGCGNCSLSCASSAIIMTVDEEGFQYPVIDESKCINCGKCVNVCPQLHEKETGDFGQIAYMAISKDRRIYKKAASGGAFATIAASFMKNHTGAVVCGAAYVDGEVRHIIVDRAEDIRQLQGSKYVQSNLDTVFVEIKKKLSTGLFVLFSGTPCQVYALQIYLGKPYENLFSVDLVCHGVPSPEFLKKDMLLYSEDGRIKEIRFRKKYKIYKSKSNYFLTLKQERSEKVVALPYNIDPYYNLFMKGWSYRYSCYRCHYANLQRGGDLTLGDCDSASLYPQFHKGEATSLVIVNTEKGQRLLQDTSELERMQIDIYREASKNHQLLKPVEMPKERDSVYKDVAEMSISDIRKKYAEPYTMKRRVYAFANAVLPRWMLPKIVRGG